MQTGEGWRLERSPALDGIRGVAVLFVVGAHASLLPVAAGPVGVSAFFALSGFLITALLLEEHAAYGRLRFRTFYLRRALRLLPALVVMLAAVALVTGLTGDIWATLLYAANWWQMHIDTGRGPLVHTWSLSIEEQFYLVWPAALLVLVRLGRVVVAAGCLLGIAGSVTAKLMLWDGGDGATRVYFGSDTRADGLLLGALVAALLVLGPHRRHQRPHAVSLLLTLVLGWGMLGTWSLQSIAVTTVVPAGVAMAIWLVMTGATPAWISGRSIVAIGRRSYGLYLWHLPTLSLGYHALGRGTGQTVLLLAASGVLTVLSWRYVEQPFLRLKERTRVTGNSQGRLRGAQPTRLPPQL